MGMVVDSVLPVGVVFVGGAMRGRDRGMEWSFSVVVYFPAVQDLY